VQFLAANNEILNVNGLSSSPLKKKALRRREPSQRRHEMPEEGSGTYLKHRPCWYRDCDAQARTDRLDQNVLGIQADRSDEEKSCSDELRSPCKQGDRAACSVPVFGPGERCLKLDGRS
jgi:hypothetical protein